MSGFLSKQIQHSSSEVPHRASSSNLEGENSARVRGWVESGLNSLSPSDEGSELSVVEGGDSVFIAAEFEEI